ncbi:hypothetical protein NDU88_003557 [Pleurodeles waltl]|uniref:Peptidase A2 domain-containing protein n=1 Tax=Pleurodeles waltl TaxID=8319 RepID=A0AAV7W6I7_PLEWA|nr:hypothetical protein NDU88_003557 [Pleurodeles waltl]
MRMLGRSGVGSCDGWADNEVGVGGMEDEAVEINGIQVKVMADSGSPFTLLSEAKWNELFKSQGFTLSQSLIQPIGYGGKSIEVVGEFNAKLKFKNNVSSATIYVAKDDACLLGWFDQGKLELVLDPNNPEQVVVRREYM